MTIPDYQKLMLPVLKLASDGEKRVVDIVDRVADEFGLTAEERDELLPSGTQRVLHNRIHWAKFYMAKAGLLASPARGKFLATKRGMELLASKPAEIDVATLLDFPEFREFYQNSKQDIQKSSTVDALRPIAQGATPEDMIDAAYRSLSAELRADIVTRILQNSPTFFEQLIVDLLVAMGYGGSHKNASAQLGRSGDGGVDGIINEDRLGLDRVYVQAKRYSPRNPAGRPEVQAFLGSLVGLGASKGVFVTTSTFSPQAYEFVKHLPQRIILIDGTRLADLMIEYGVGVRNYRVVEFKRVDEDFFIEE